MQLTEAELAAAAATAVKLVGTRAQVVTALRERVRLIAAAHDRYLAVTGAPSWQVAASDRYAHLIDDLDRDVATARDARSPTRARPRSAAVPSTDDEQLPPSGVVDHAAELYERAHRLAVDNHVISSYALDARAQLSRLRPDAYPPEHEARGELRGGPAVVLAPISELTPRP